MREPADLYPACITDFSVGDVNSDAARERRRAENSAAVAALKPRLKAGDRIRAVRAECGAGPATYTFAKWDGNWIVSASGINTIIPASISSINGEPVNFRTVAP